MIALLLHHHQPDYRDPRTGEPTLPWVRLHATRGYRDVAVALRETGARATVNLVPSLLDQLDHYALGGGDAWLRRTATPPEALSAVDRAHVVNTGFLGNPSMFEWFPAYARLRGRVLAGEVLDDAGVRDLQVWSQLAWFGWSALRDWPELAELRQKGAGFSEAEKQRVLEVQRAVLGGLRELHQGLPEVSASPYFHPILPLLVDTAHARRAHPGLPDPGFRHPEDAREQLRRGKARVEGWVGGPVEGLWPSEGSVSPEVLDIAQGEGFRWIATDEGVLARSERAARPVGGAEHRGPWEAGAGRLVFRDRELSDRIGFQYARVDGRVAVADLLARAGTAPVLVALDGENPWEAFADAGRSFFVPLCESGRLRTVGEFARLAPRGAVQRVHTGSWIGAAFDIWIGHEEDRTAWRWLARCRADWDDAGRPEGARAHLYAAEGSDWFWWYGEEFETPVAAEFDRLFRAHLAAAWRAMGREAPADLAIPIKRPRFPVELPRAPWAAPPGDDWYTWSRAGRLRVRGGAMALDARWPRQVEYGRYDDAWWFRRAGGAGDWWVEVGGHREALGEAWARVGEGEGEACVSGPGGAELRVALRMA